MNQVSKIEQQGLPAAAVSDAGSLMNALVQVAKDPACDPEKMLAMHRLIKEIRADEAEFNFNQAMAAAQSEMKRIAPDAYNTQTKSRYASYGTLDQSVRPIYTKHGFSLSFDTGETQENWVNVVCFVSCAGHTRRYSFPMPADGKGAKGGDVMTKTHAAGSAATYGRRYLLCMIFNIAIGGEDDDGNAAGRKDPGNGNDATGEIISDGQADVIRSLLVGKDINVFLKWAKVESVSDIYVADYDFIVKKLTASKKQAAQ